MAAHGYTVRKNGKVIDFGAKIGERRDVLTEMQLVHGNDAEVLIFGSGTDDSFAEILEDAKRIADGLKPIHAKSPLEQTGVAQDRMKLAVALMKQFAEKRKISAEKAMEIVNKGRYGQMVSDFIYSGKPSLQEIERFLLTDPNLPEERA